MKLTEQNIRDDELQLFEEVKQIVEKTKTAKISVNGYEGDHFATTLIIAKVIASMFNLRCVQGKFGQHHRHVWIITNHNNIIDVNPIATVGGPIIWNGKTQYLSAIFQEEIDRNNQASKYDFHIRLLEKEIRKT